MPSYNQRVANVGLPKGGLLSAVTDPSHMPIILAVLLGVFLVWFLLPDEILYGRKKDEVEEVGSKKDAKKKERRFSISLCMNMDETSYDPNTHGRFISYYESLILDGHSFSTSLELDEAGKEKCLFEIQGRLREFAGVERPISQIRAFVEKLEKEDKRWFEAFILHTGGNEAGEKEQRDWYATTLIHKMVPEHRLLWSDTAEGRVNQIRAVAPTVHVDETAKVANDLIFVKVPAVCFDGEASESRYRSAVDAGVLLQLEREGKIAWASE